MRLLVVSSWCPWPPVNGSKLRAYHLLRELATRHAITLLSFAETNEESDAGAALGGLCEHVRFVAGNPFKPTKPLGARAIFSHVPRSYAQTYSPEMASLVDGAVTGHDAAIAFQIGAALYLNHRKSLPRIFEEAEITVAYDRFACERGPIRRTREGLTWWKLARFARSLVDQFDRTTVVSEVERLRLGAAGCDLRKIAVIPNGVERLHLERSERPDPHRLVYPGSVTYSANYDAVRFFADNVLPCLARQKVSAVLHVTGSTQGVDIAQLSANERITFTGHRDDIETFIARSAVCVVPLRIGGGTRLKILQAMALGTPVVATSKGAEGLAVTHGRDILIADEPDAFADAVVSLLNDENLRHRLTTAARELVRQSYTWDAIGQRFENVLHDAVARVGMARL
jgi:glycosyltransferase involved in cell wall biosynthesis